MAHEVTMPQMGYDMTEGTINEWRVKEGDTVSRGDTIASVATDKADIDIEAFAGGVVRKIVMQPGTTVPVGTVIAWIGEPGESIPEITATEPGSNGAAETPMIAEAAGAAAEDVGEASGAEAEAGGADGATGRVKASPYARRRATELGVDLAGVRGSGPGGRIVAQDVERAVAPQGAGKPEKGKIAAKQAEGRKTGKAGAAAQVSAGDDPYTEAEPSRLRRALARTMVEAKTTVPHFYLSVDVDAEALLRLRAEVNRLGPEAPKLSVTDLIVRACAMTLQSHPRLNAAWIDGKVRQFERSNVAVAVALTDGLIAPTLRNLDGISMRELAHRLHDLVDRAKSNRLRQEELSGAHMAVSNLGMFGIEEFAAIITPPQSSVLAVGAVRDTPVVVEGTVKPGKRMRMTLSIDHRVTDGAQGAEALERIRWLLEHPAALLV